MKEFNMKKIAITIAVAVVATLGYASPADAAHRSFAQRCIDQHKHPHSKMAKKCERRNWVITRQYVMAPDGRLWEKGSGWDARRPVDYDQTLPAHEAYWWNGGVPCKFQENVWDASDDNMPFCPAQ